MTSHHLQSQADGCVAAAMCIIQRWLGQAPTEQAFLAANPHHDPMLVARQLVGIQAMCLAVGDEREIALALLSARVAAVTVVSQHYEQWLRRRYPDLVSHHGRFGGAAMPLHMVVLVSRARDGYELLDPFFDGLKYDGHRQIRFKGDAAHYGEVLWALGQRDRAIAIWKEGKLINPENETLLETLKRLRVKL